MATARARFVFEAVDKTRATVRSVQQNVSTTSKRFRAMGAAARKASREIQASFRGAEKSLNRLSKSATNAGRSLTTKLTAPTALLGGAILKVAGDFEAGMNRVQVKTGATADEFARLRDQAKALGSSTQFSATQAAEGQEILATAGLEVAQIYDSLPGVLNLAGAGQIELGEAARFTAGTLKGFNLEADQAGRVTDVITKASLLADQSVADMGAAMQKVAGVAGVFGLQVEDTSAALAVLAESGRRGEEGGTALLNFLQELKNPASKARQELDRLGLSVTNADGTLKDLGTILDTFQAAGFNAANGMDIFAKRTGTTFTLLANGRAKLSEFRGELNDAAGTAAEVSAANLKGLNGELTKLRSALEGLAIAIADSGLLAWVTSLVAKVSDLASRLSETNPSILRTGTLIAGLAAAIGPAVLAAGLLAGALGQLAGLGATISALGVSIGGLGAVLSGPVLLGAVAVTAAVVALVDAWRNGEKWIRVVADLFNEVARDLSATLEPVLRIIGTVFTQVLLPALRTAGEALITGLAVAFRIVAGVIRTVLGPLLEELAKWIGEVIPKVVDFAKRAWDGFVRFVRQAAEKLLQTLANVLGFLAKIPGAIGDSFANGAEALEGFATAVGDLETPVGEAVAAVTGFGAALETAQNRAANTTPWDKFLDKLKEITTTANEAGEAVSEAAGEDEEDEDAPGSQEEAENQTKLEKALRGLLDLKRVGDSVSSSLSASLHSAMTDFQGVTQTTANVFKSVFSAVIDEIARQIAAKLTAQLLGFIGGLVGGPLGSFLGGAAGGGLSRSAPSIGGASSTTAPAPAQNVTVIASLIPEATPNAVRAGRGVRNVNAQTARFVLGGEVAL